MAVSIHQIGRWYLMLTGKSVWHVNQDIGKCFAKDEIRGYYNNMTEKVTRMPDLLDSDEMPKLNLAEVKFTYFPVAIFQYGFGCYDVLPSRMEGFPNVVLEAMCFNRPVASTTCVAVIKDIIRERQNGFYCEIENADALADCMIKASQLKNIDNNYDLFDLEKLLDVFK